MVAGLFAAAGGAAVRSRPHRQAGRGRRGLQHPGLDVAPAPGRRRAGRRRRRLVLPPVGPRGDPGGQCTPADLRTRARRRPRPGRPARRAPPSASPHLQPGAAGRPRADVGSPRRRPPHAGRAAGPVAGGARHQRRRRGPRPPRHAVRLRLRRHRLGGCPRQRRVAAAGERGAPPVDPLGRLSGSGATSSRRPRPAHQRRCRAGRTRAARGAVEPPPRADHPRAPPSHRVRRMGVRGRDDARSGHHRPVRRPERHGQDAGGRGGRPASCSSTSTASTCRPW